MATYVQQEENAGTNGNLMEPSNRNEIEMMKKDIRLDGEEGGETGESQRQKYKELEAKVTGENSNNRNAAIITTVQLLKKQVKKENNEDKN